MRDELPALTTFQQIGLIFATPSYNDGEAYLDEGDMTSVAVLLDTYKAERDAERDAAIVRAEAAEAEARECRAERARYGDAMTEKLAAVEAERDAARALAFRMRQERDEYAAAHEQLSCGHPAAFIAAPAGCDPRCELCVVRAERDALRERCIEWLPFNEAAETIDSILVWREDAGVFVAFYADEQECWFTSFGEDLTGDLPTFYAKMPQGPTSK